MPLHRFQIDLAIPDPIPKALLQKPTTQQLTAMANMTWIQIVRAMIQRLKGFSQKINEGTSREEDTIRAKKHICKHDIGQSCDGGEDI